LLPSEFRKGIPYTTISTWRKTDFSKYKGNELRGLFDEAFQIRVYRNDYKKMRKAMLGFAKSWISISPMITPLIKTAGDDKHSQKNVIDAVGYLREQIGLDRSLRILGLTKAQYRQWVLESQFHCFDSFKSLCMKRHPNQLGLKEIKNIKAMLTDPDKDHWPIVSIAALALRKKKVVASLYSWYKYARIFNVTKKLLKKDCKTIGLIATSPNEYLHVDTTYYPYVEDKTVCITFVMDNYSKMILGFYVAEKLSFDLVKQALINSLLVIMRHPDQEHSYLVADGGSENHNRQIDEFIAGLSGHRITKITALKDIRFSNSPVEAVHRTIKGRYLRNKKFNTLEALVKYLDWAVMDYNELRPHYRHRPRTPEEVYFNKPLDFNVRERVIKAMKERVITNKCSDCTQCKDFRNNGCCGGKEKSS